jgi:hypothetical protein
LYAAGVTWLLIRIRGPRPNPPAALGFGAAVGAFIGVTGTLAIYSAVRLPASALLVFPVSQTAVFAAGSVSAALVLRALRPWRRVALLAGACVIVCSVAVILQNRMPR